MELRFIEVKPVSLWWFGMGSHLQMVLPCTVERTHKPSFEFQICHLLADNLAQVPF